MSNGLLPGAQEAAQTVDGVDAHQQAMARGERPAAVRSAPPILTLATVVVEMIPGGLGPWGIGDVVTAIEALAGRTIDGLRLSRSERLVYLGASAIPLVPARPIIGVYRMLTGAHGGGASHLSHTMADASRPADTFRPAVAAFERSAPIRPDDLGVPAATGPGGGAMRTTIGALLVVLVLVVVALLAVLFAIGLIHL
jgi:hypothetical protein